MDFQKDYYAILGVNAGASQAEIKKAYRQLAKKYHPDLNQGNKESEEITKGVTEAYGVLGNDESKFIYDQYRNSRNANPNLSEDKGQAMQPAKHKRTYTKKSIVTVQKNVYIVGKIVLKYYGLQDVQLSQSINDLYFSIHPTDISAEVRHENIFGEGEMPADVEKMFALSKPAHFDLHNTRTEIIYEDHKETYQLDLRKPIIIDPVITDVTKHEGISHGTLTGTFYSVFEHNEEQEIEEIVEECFGETGRKEENADENNIYRRVEYYNSDCTTYWGPWITEPIRKRSPGSGKWDSDWSGTGTTGGSATGKNWTGRSGNSRWQSRWRKSYFGRTFKRRSAQHQFGDGGCGMIPFIFIGGFLIWNLFKLLNPITWLIGLIILLLLLRNSGWFLNLMLRIGGLIISLLFLISIWTEFKPDVNERRSQKVDDSRETTTVTARVQERTSRQEEELEVTGQIISHYRVWNDFAGNKYEGEMRIFLSDFQRARKDHDAMDFQLQGEADWPKVYFQLLENDRGRLNMLYSMFDSIQSVKQLDRLGFAEMVVSCIQDIPYYLVLPDECAVHNHEDPFVRNFIENRPGYCIGNISYGVQSPAEFLGNLKGDCDTRVALLFAIFNHYKYNVAILGSNQFKHAVLGIELPGAGLEMNYRGINYKLWETTSGGFRPGILAPEVSDLNYWNFYLTN